MPAQDEVIAERTRAMYEKDFVPKQINTPDARSAEALEYIAHQAGVIRRDISAIRAALEQLAKP